MKKLVLILTISLFFLPHTCLSAGEFRKLPVDTYVDKMKAGWVGQMAGVGWGGPTEFRWCGEIIPEDEDAGMEAITDQSVLPGRHLRGNDVLAYFGALWL